MYQRRTNRYQRRSSSTRLGAPKALPPELMRRIDADPAFQMMTQDRQTWIDPYTGKGLPASLGRVQAAREYLLENEQIWRNGQSTLPLTRLEYERWRQDLLILLPAEPRLRIFGRAGTWLNPYSGEFVPGITRDDGRISFKTLSRMAKHLCMNPMARTGRLLEAPAIAEALKREVIRTGAASPVLDEAMTKASNVQRKMLPDMPRLERFGVAVHYRAHHGVSGDFYDIITLPDGRVLFVIGDVSGHGLQAALVVATALKTLRFVARQAGSLVELLARLNDEMKPDLIPGQFITVFAAALDEDSGELSCVRAGHHPALVVNLDGEVILRRLGKSGMAIGLTTGVTFASTLREERIVLEPGEMLLQYTDGLVEAIGTDESPYGEARLCASILSHLERGPQQLVDSIAEDVSRWAGGPVGDDVTLLILCALHTPRGPGSGTVPGPMLVTAEPLAMDGMSTASAEGPVQDQDAEEAVADDSEEEASSPSETGELQAPAAAG